MRKEVLVLAVVLAVGGCAGQEHAATPAVTPSTAAADTAGIAARSERVLNDSIGENEPGCSAAVGREGVVVWAGARGVADVATGAKITTDTVFDIASVSKQFTATAVLLLADGGLLTLDDPIVDFLPELPDWAATVTVAQLMHQTSGIPDYIDLLQDAGYEYSDRTTQNDALRVLATVPALEYEPGTQFEYSNSNYLLLGEIVQRVSGQPLPQFLSAKIFQPLDLAMSLDPVGAVANKAVSYEEGSPAPDAAWEQVGDGGIATTPTQLVRWADNYRTGKLGGRALLEAQLAGAAETEPGSDGHYAAGIYVYPDGTLDHDGSWAGFVTAFRVSPDRRTSVAISCNTDEQDPEALADQLMPLWK